VPDCRSWLPTLSGGADARRSSRLAELVRERLRFPTPRIKARTTNNAVVPVRDGHFSLGQDPSRPKGAHCLGKFCGVRRPHAQAHFPPVAWRRVFSPQRPSSRGPPRFTPSPATPPRPFRSDESQTFIPVAAAAPAGRTICPPEGGPHAGRLKPRSNGEMTHGLDRAWLMEALASVGGRRCRCCASALEGPSRRENTQSRGEWTRGCVPSVHIGLRRKESCCPVPPKRCPTTDINGRQHAALAANNASDPATAAHVVGFLR